MTSFANIPSGSTLNVSPFRAHVDEEKLQHFRKLLELSPVAPPVFENSRAGRKYGITRAWLENAKATWLNEFDWRKQEDRINSFPNFKAIVQDTDGNSTDVHFLALFSEKPEAVPIAFIHGWPSSFAEFLDMLDILRHKYASNHLPYHIIVPSLPGYAYSSGPPMDKDYGIEVAAHVIDSLMIGLGFGSGYLTHGGDLGSFISRYLAMTSSVCKGMHVNMMGMPPAEMLDETLMDGSEKRAWTRAVEFIDTEYAFALEQGTKPATIGFALSASPLALLSWLAEKVLAWSDEDPPLEKILELVTLYWMTDTIARCFWHNRGMGNANDDPKVARISVVTNLSALKLPYVEKPCGYSLFAQELVPIPKSWAVKSCNLVSYNQHDQGGHFPAMEKPTELLADIEAYIKVAWNAPPGQ